MGNLSNQLNAAIKDITDVYGSVKPAMPGIVRIINNAINKNFAQKGRWNGDTGSQVTLFSGGSRRWVPLADSTKRNYKRKGYELEATLYRQGELKRATEVRQRGDSSVVISSNSPKAAIHQFGGTIVIPPHERTQKFKTSKSKKKIKNDKGKETWNGKYQYRFAKKNAKGKNVIEKKSAIKERRIHIPARPFITLTPEDLIEIRDYLRQTWQK